MTEACANVSHETKIKFTILGEPALLRRFMAKAVLGSGCWTWTGAPSDNTPTGQYGRFRVHGIQVRAHRVSWMLHKGPIPVGLQVLHHCDNPRCVNPSHLFLGTNDDNVKDRVAKGRSGWQSRSGEAHHLCKLNDKAVRSIRKRFATGEQGKSLALEFSVSRATISEIVTMRKWRHV